MPLLGWSANNLTQFETAGASWYNGLNVSLTKRLSRGLQFLASYTLASSLSTDNSPSTGGNGGTALGNQNDPRQRYGRNNFVRPQRLILSYVYTLPGPADRSGFKEILAGWSVAGVTTFQSGQRLSITATNARNAFGITSDRAQLTGNCTPSQYVTPGAVNDKLGAYFNRACFSTAFTIIGDDGMATAFGNRGVGIVSGPDQRNFDISMIKHTPLRVLERLDLEFRADLFNAFNTTQFSNPTTSLTSATFGQVLSTNVSPRIVQFALKLNF